MKGAFDLVNLIPHPLNIAGVEYPPSGQVARVTLLHQQMVGEVNGAIVMQNYFGEVENLPDPKENTVYIVSGLVLAHLNGERDDVLAPDTGATAIRDEKGRIIGVTQLIK